MTASIRPYILIIAALAFAQACPPGLLPCGFFVCYRPQDSCCINGFVRHAAQCVAPGPPPSPPSPPSPPKVKTMTSTSAAPTTLSSSTPKISTTSFTPVITSAPKPSTAAPATSSTSAPATSTAAPTTSSVASTVAPTSAPAASTAQCAPMFASLQCRTASEDTSQVDLAAVASARSWLCSTYPQYCVDINSGGKYSSCNSAEQISFAMNAYYNDHQTQGAGACSFGGVGVIVGVTSSSQASTYNKMSTSTFGQSTSSTTSQNSVPTTTGNTPIVQPIPAPIPKPTVPKNSTNNCAAGQSSCAGQCYDPTLFGCSSNANGVQQFLCPAPTPSTQSSFWMQNIKHEGISAFLGDSSYVVYRNVKDYGAVGDGVTDDTAAINNAITAYGRCGQGCDSTTTRPALVYFPAGKYLISSPIIQYYLTQLVGDATNMPTLLAASTFKGMAMIDSDPYGSGGNNWYTNQNNFYRQVRNFVMDTTQTPAGKGTTCIHWQVAQATSLTNLVFNMSPGSTHQGIWMENGSGGWMSDLVFYGGAFALWVGNQQFTSRNITIYGSTTGIYMNWNWGWTFKTLYISGAQTGVDMTSLGDKGQQLVGSVILTDVQMVNTVVGIKTGTGTSTSMATSDSLLIDNAYFTNVGTVVASANGNSVIAGNSQGTVYVPTWAQGHVYTAAMSSDAHFGYLSQTKRPAALVDLSQGNNYYFEKPKPQYENYGVSAFVSVKDEGAYGDGVHDDTAAIQAVLYKYAGCRIIYFPAGAYILSYTVVVPAGSRIVGEVWSSLMANGKAFQDPNNPVPVIQVGNPGDVGVAELSDLLFTAQGPQPGAILVQWNIQDPQGAQGSAGMWDCHFRVGGAAGSNQQIGTCPKYQNPTQQCIGTFMLMHVTSSASAYLENVWAWTADHDLDAFGADMSGQISVFNGRGLLLESTAGAWLYGTAVEHNWFYQYQLQNAENVLMAMIQTETPYYQVAPYYAPWESNSAYNDPDFSGCSAGSPSCSMAWGMRYIDTQNVYVYGAGHYNFFQYYNQTCLNTENCQDAMVDISTDDSSELYLYGLNTKASVGMVHNYGEIAALATDNVNTFCSTIHYLANTQQKR